MSANTVALMNVHLYPLTSDSPSISCTATRCSISVVCLNPAKILLVAGLRNSLNKNLPSGPQHLLYSSKRSINLDFS